MGEDCIPVPWEVTDKNSRWLSNSMVATVRCERSIPSIPAICETQGGVKVARLGGMKVLITFRDLGEVLPVI